MGRKYTWAYINTTAEGDVAPAEGAFGSIQTKDRDGGFKGHANLTYQTSSNADVSEPTTARTTHLLKLTGDFAMAGDIFCTGSIYARNYYIKNVGFMDLTGSTKFGDHLADTHDFKGDVILDTTSRLYFHDEAGGEYLRASSDGHLEVNAGTTLDQSAPTIQLNGGTLIDVNAGTFDVDATTAVAIDTSNTSNGVSIGTATSGVPISIGHTVSETTVNDNLTVTGDAAVTGDVTVTGESTFNDLLTINQDDNQVGLYVNKTNSSAGVLIQTDANQTALKVQPAAQASGQAVHIDTDGITAGTGLLVGDDGSTGDKLSSGNLAKFYSNSNNTENRNLVSIHNDSTSATGAQCLKILQDASGVDAIEVLGPSGVNILRGSDEGVILGGATSTYKGALHVYSNDDTRYPAITIDAANTNDQRDARLHWALGGNEKYTLGIDDSDSDKIKFGTTSLTTNVFLEANSSGEITALGDDTPSSNEVLTWDGNKAVWEPASGGAATSLVNPSGHAVISAADNVHVTLDSDDTELSYFRVLDGDGFIHYSLSEQGDAIFRGHSGSATDGAKLFMSASNSAAANSAEITFRKTHFADGGTFSAGDNLGSVRFQGSDAGIPSDSSIVIVGEVAAGTIPDASAESWSQGAQMGAELKFSVKKTGTNTFNTSLVLDGLGAQIGGRLYGPSADHFVLSSDKDFQIRIDEDGDGSHSFQVFNGTGASMFHVLENGATNIVGDLTVAGHDIKNSDNEICITMDADQRVGIGGVSPAYKLDIDGDIRIRGNDIRDSAGNVAIQFDGSQNTQVKGILSGPTDSAFYVHSDAGFILHLDEDESSDANASNFRIYNGSNNIIFNVNESAEVTAVASLAGVDNTDLEIRSDTNVTIKLDYDSSTDPNSNQELQVHSGAGNKVWYVNESGDMMADKVMIVPNQWNGNIGQGVLHISGSSIGNSNAPRMYFDHQDNDSVAADDNIGEIHFRKKEGVAGTDIQNFTTVAKIVGHIDPLETDYTIADNTGGAVTIHTCGPGQSSLIERFRFDQAGIHAAGNLPMKLHSPNDFEIHLDSADGDDDGNRTFEIYNGAGTAKFTVDETGATVMDGTLSVAGGYGSSGLTVASDGDLSTNGNIQAAECQLTLGGFGSVEVGGGYSGGSGITLHSDGELSINGSSILVHNTNSRSDIIVRRYDTTMAQWHELGGLFFKGSESTATSTANRAAVTAQAYLDWATYTPTQITLWTTPTSATSNSQTATFRAVDSTDCLRLDGNVDTDAFFSEGHQYPSTTEESELIEQGDCLALIDGELVRTSIPMQKNVAGIAWYRMSDKKFKPEEEGGNPFAPIINAESTPELVTKESDPDFGKYITILDNGEKLVYNDMEHFEQTKDRAREKSKVWIDSLGNSYSVATRQDENSEWTADPDFKKVWKTISLGDSRQYIDIDRETNSVQKMSGFKVCDEGGSISAGDLLCTSSKTGRLMKQSDDLMHSHTVAKAMEDITFDADGNADGVYGYVYCG